jgi:hypothetical protein
LDNVHSHFVDKNGVLTIKTGEKQYHCPMTGKSYFSYFKSMLKNAIKIKLSELNETRYMDDFWQFG